MVEEIIEYVMTAEGIIILILSSVILWWLLKKIPSSKGKGSSQTRRENITYDIKKDVRKEVSKMVLRRDMLNVGGFSLLTFIMIVVGACLVALPFVVLLSPFVPVIMEILEIIKSS